MRNKLMLMVFGLAVMVAMPSFAAEKKVHHNHVKGVISSVDEANHKITIKKTGSQESVTINVGDLNNLKEGQHVKVTLKDGSTDEADHVMVMESHKGKTK